MVVQQSPLHDRHVALGAKFAEFGGWEMPLEYPTGTLKEHDAVRTSVGIFDVSHLGKVVVRGAGAEDFINSVFTNDLAGAWRAFSELEVGGVIVNDIPTYRIDHMPYGGVKDSGLGREGLRWAIDDMTEVRIMVLAWPQ